MLYPLSYGGKPGANYATAPYRPCPASELLGGESVLLLLGLIPDHAVEQAQVVFGNCVETKPKLDRSVFVVPIGHDLHQSIEIYLLNQQYAMNHTSRFKDFRIGQWLRRKPGEAEFRDKAQYALLRAGIQPDGRPAGNGPALMDPAVVAVGGEIADVVHCCVQ